MREYTFWSSGRPMGLRFTATFIAFTWSAAAAITNISVQGTTSTQAVLRYTAPDAGVCAYPAADAPSARPTTATVIPAFTDCPPRTARPVRQQR